MLAPESNAQLMRRLRQDAIRTELKYSKRNKELVQKIHNLTSFIKRHYAVGKYKS